MVEVFEKLIELLRGGRTVALASIVSASGSTPQDSGARMIITADGGTYFTIGGGGLEAAVVRDGLEAIKNGQNLVKNYNLAGIGEGGVGMACGGNTTIVIEVISPPHRLLIFGAGHVGRSLAYCAQGLGLAVTVVDDRSEYPSADRFPEGIELRRVSSGYEGDIPEADESTYVTIVTRSHETDLTVLRNVIRHRSAYIGMIGSRRKVEQAFAILKAEGVSSSALDQVHSPIGLDIGSKTPREIAISILAEIIKVRNAHRGAR